MCPVRVQVGGFLSTLSLRRATHGQKRKSRHSAFLSTLSLRRATQLMCFWPFGRLFLSTLSLRRATHPKTPSHPHNTNFYPRSPCGERLRFLCMRFSPILFLSTLSLRRATISIVLLLLQIRFLSTLSLRRATHIVGRAGNNTIHFYPRSPCGERPRGEHHANSQQEFLSTLSLRRATWPGLLARPFFLISIHALLAESDAIARIYTPVGLSAISIHALLAESDVLKL